MKFRMKPMLFLVAVFLLALQSVDSQQPLQPPTAQDSRSEPRTLRLIDLRDLLLADAAIPDFTEQEHDAPPPPSMDDAGKIAQRAEQWQLMLRLWITPSLSKDLDRLELLPNGTLVAQLPAAGQAWLDRYFVLQRAERTIFTSEFKILVCSKGAFDSLLPAPGSKSSTQDWTLELQGHALPVGSKATSGLFLPGSDLLTTEDIERLLNAVQTQAGADLLNAPKLTMFTRALGQLSTYDEIEYVKDWSLKVVEPGHKMIAVPEIGSVRDGLGVQVRGVQLDGDLLGLEVELWQSVVKQPIRTSNVHLDVDGGRDLEVALPQVDSQRLRSRLAIRPGSSVYFRGPGPTEDKEMLVLLTVTRGDAATKEEK